MRYNMWAQIITYTILGVPYFDYSIMGPYPSLIVQAPILPSPAVSAFAGPACRLLLQNITLT